MKLKCVTENTNLFDNLKNRPDKPTSQEIANIIYPIPSGVNDNAGCPTGMVGTFFGLTAPSGWLVCDGTKYNKTDYPSLFAHLSTFPSERRAEWGNADWIDEFNVPNLLGEFPRFSGTNSHTNQGSGANVGVHQDASEINNIITKQSTTQLQAHTSTSGSSWEQGIKNYDSQAKTGDNKFLIFNASSSGSDLTGLDYVTIRPTNTSFLPIIKY